MDPFPLWCGRVAVTVFFALAFAQSAVDKLVDRQGNLAYFSGHFATSPLRHLVVPLFWAITLLEAVAGLLCSLGAVGMILGLGAGLALWGLLCALLSLLCLFFGQRLAKDYAGAVVIASYMAVALIGLGFFALKSTP
ncbi:MAG: DoxX family protein [Candidatus Tectimicrobiota bacterium]